MTQPGEPRVNLHQLLKAMVEKGAEAAYRAGFAAANPGQEVRDVKPPAAHTLRTAILASLRAVGVVLPAASRWNTGVRRTPDRTSKGRSRAAIVRRAVRNLFATSGITDQTMHILVDVPRA